MSYPRVTCIVVLCLSSLFAHSTLLHSLLFVAAYYTRSKQLTTKARSGLRLPCKHSALIRRLYDYRYNSIPSLSRSKLRLVPGNTPVPLLERIHKKNKQHRPHNGHDHPHHTPTRHRRQRLLLRLRHKLLRRRPLLMVVESRTSNPAHLNLSFPS